MNVFSFQCLLLEIHRLTAPQTRKKQSQASPSPLITETGDDCKLLFSNLCAAGTHERFELRRWLLVSSTFELCVIETFFFSGERYSRRKSSFRLARSFD